MGKNPALFIGGLKCPNWAEMFQPQICLDLSFWDIFGFKLDRYNMRQYVV